MAWTHRQNDLPTEVVYLSKLQEKFDDNRYFTILRYVAGWSNPTQNANWVPQLKGQIMQIISWLEDDIESIRELNCILPPAVALLVPPRSMLGKDAKEFYGTLLTEQSGEILSLKQSPDTGGFRVIFDSDDLLTVQGNHDDWGDCIKTGEKEGWGACLTDLLSREVDDPLNPESTRQLAFRRQVEMLEKHEYCPTHLLLHNVTRTGMRSERVPCVFTFADSYRGEMGGGRAVCLRIFQKPKMRDSDWLKDHQFKRSVLREVLPWCKLRHPNVLPFLGLSKFSTYPRETGRWTLVVPWLERKDVLTYVSDKNPDMRFRRNAVCDIVQGLMYLHEQTPPIFHGDLRAAHVLVDGDGTCLLINFNTYQMSTGYTDRIPSPAYSRERWQAPEVFQGEPNASAAKAAANVYSLGCVMLEIYSGRNPTFDEQWDIRDLVFEKDRRPEVPPGIPKEILETMGKCWAREPSERPQMAYLADEYVADRPGLSGDSTMHLDVRQRWSWRAQPEMTSQWVAQEISSLAERGAQMQENLPNVLYLCQDYTSVSGRLYHSKKKPKRPAGFLRALDQARG